MGRALSTGLREALPLAALNIPLGIVCGILFKERGYAWYTAPIFSACINAAAMQFLTLTILAAGGSLPLLIFSLIPIGVRNIFYGLTMVERYNKAPPLLRAYLAFGLIDGIYSILQIGPRLEEKEDIPYIFHLTTIAHGTWILGSLLGSFVHLLFPIPPRLEFALTAFFAAASFELFRKQREWGALWIGLSAIVIAAWLTPSYLLPCGIGIAAFGALVWPQKGVKT